MSNIITVSREFGSGGRELGKRLADELGVAYFDKEILEAIAEQTNTSEWYAQEVLERGMLPGYALHFGHSFSYYSPVAQQAVNLMVAERKVIKELAEKQDCVIVGRGANKILEKEEPFNIFIYADMESKMARCRERAPEDEHLTKNINFSNFFYINNIFFNLFVYSFNLMHMLNTCICSICCCSGTR